MISKSMQLYKDYRTIRAKMCTRRSSVKLHFVCWQDFCMKRNYSTYYLLTRNKVTATNSRVFSRFECHSRIPQRFSAKTLRSARLNYLRFNFLIDVIREFKQIATAGAATATGSKIVKKRVIVHVSCSHPAVA